ncbi:MAG: sulfatase [Deltaproteobacteria bacterium]|nr:sulfatase [Deltaproteobacteria bacterium]
MRNLTRVAAATALLFLGCGGEAPPSVLLVTIDTTRVDHLSTYGYPRETTPNLSRLARESVRYTRAWSVSPWTLPAHASLFTGLVPAVHGAHSDLGASTTLADAIDGPLAPMASVGRLGDDTLTLAEILAERGYRTAAFVGGPWLKRPFGLMQGFEVVDDDVSDVVGRRADELTDAALAWLAVVDPRDPVFLFVNYYDPHWPYDPPPGFDDFPSAREAFELPPNLGELISGRTSLSDSEREVVLARYDGEIRYADHHLGILLEAVMARPDGDRTLVIVSSDHGEAFGEEGRYFHSYWLSEELLRIPLIVRYPDLRGAGTVDESTVQISDVPRIIVDALGLELPVAGKLPGEREVAFAELYRQKLAISFSRARFDRDLEAAIRWPFKLIRSDRGSRELFRLGEVREHSALELAPGSVQPAGGPPAERSAMNELTSSLDEHRARAKTTAPTRPLVDDGTRELLRKLGYTE